MDETPEQVFSKSRSRPSHLRQKGKQQIVETLGLVALSPVARPVEEMQVRDTLAGRAPAL
jgi:hypothetical protein